jgi:hypothetical protein
VIVCSHHSGAKTKKAGRQCGPGIRALENSTLTPGCMLSPHSGLRAVRKSEPQMRGSSYNPINSLTYFAGGEPNDSIESCICL